MKRVYHPDLGADIREACREAIKRANLLGKEIEFNFNDVEVVAHPGDFPCVLINKWIVDCEKVRQPYLQSPEYLKKKEERAAKDRQKREAVLVEQAQTEKEMRETPNPKPSTRKQLLEYIDSLIERKHDYGTCVYAMSLAAVAAFNFVAHELGVSGFQASCADLDFIRRTRAMKGPFILLKAEDMLFPQYDLTAQLSEAMNEWQPWLKEEAEELLNEISGAHPDVVRHWRMLARTGSPKP